MENKMQRVVGYLMMIGIVVSSLHAGMFSMVSGMTMKQIKPQAAYTVDTAGINPRVYEFNTKVEPIMHCVVLIASSDKFSAPAMQCTKIEK